MHLTSSRCSTARSRAGVNRKRLNITDIPHPTFDFEYLRWWITFMIVGEA
jgi:hypothetical protein